MEGYIFEKGVWCGGSEPGWFSRGGVVGICQSEVTGQVERWCQSCIKDGHVVGQVVHSCLIG